MAPYKPLFCPVVIEKQTWHFRFCWILSPNPTPTSVWNFQRCSKSYLLSEWCHNVLYFQTDLFWLLLPCISQQQIEFLAFNLSQTHNETLNTISLQNSMGCNHIPENQILNYLFLLMPLIPVLTAWEVIEVNVHDQLLLSAWELIHSTPKSWPSYTKTS